MCKSNFRVNLYLSSFILVYNYSCDENRLNNLKIYLKRELIDKISRGEWIINGDKERSDISNDNVPDNDDRSINRRRLFETFESSVVSMKDSTVGCDPFFIERGKCWHLKKNNNLRTI